jgi:transposase InsO family protein
MAEAWVATFKTELVDQRSFPNYEHAEHEVFHLIGVYNTERLHEELGGRSPTEFEEEHYRLSIKTDNIRMPQTTRMSL